MVMGDIDHHFDTLVQGGDAKIVTFHTQLI
ncbi:Uncharacterised protein [Vibrio cholerae]|nr:Uncharacterised protein [Vibrio cholerae]CSI13484.1 Uncharacterised protein [Vibrio cholerae]